MRYGSYFGSLRFVNFESDLFAHAPHSADSYADELNFMQEQRTIWDRRNAYNARTEQNYNVLIHAHDMDAFKGLASLGTALEIGVDTMVSFALPGMSAARRVAAVQKALPQAAKTGSQFTRSSLKLGQQMHKAYKEGLADGVKTFKEFRLPSGRRIDFLDVAKGIIYELKPNNPRAIREGTQQLQNYLREIQSMPQFQGINWQTVLHTY